MTKKNHAVIILIFIAVFCYFVYSLYWAAKTIPWIVDISFHPEIFYPPAGLLIVNEYSISVSYLMEYVGFIGLLIRVIAASIALLTIASILKSGAYFTTTSNLRISRALFLEGAYFLTFIPAIYYLLTFSALPLTSNLCLTGALAIQVVIAPFLIALSLKIKNAEWSKPPKSILNFAILTCLIYVAAIWITYLFKWTEMAALEGVIWLFIPPRVVAFSNTMIILSLATIFAVFGSLAHIRRNNESKMIKWWGLSAILLSLHIIIFALFCISFNAAYLAIFGELWTIPFLGMGIYLLSKRKTAIQ